MPVTKKKGAIFAIYADSPTHSSTTHGPSKSSVPVPSTSTSPTKRSTTRKALSALQPSTMKGFPVSSIKSDHDTLKPTSTKTNPKPSTLAPKFAALPTKRQLEIFSSPATKPAIRHIGGSSATKPAVQHTGGSPAKRTRQTPRDKENNPPPSIGAIEGSPASRTRSKTSSIGSATQFAQLASSSPRPKVSTTRLASSSPRNQVTITKQPSRTAGRLGALTLKSATTTIRREDSQTYLSGVHLELADGEPSGLTPRAISKVSKGTRAISTVTKATQFMSESTDGSRSTNTSKTTLGEIKRKGGKGLSVRADGPLVDVSEAYGASGEEPVGFRDQ